MNAEQFGFRFKHDWENCQHSGFYTQAEVPGGFYCDRSATLLWRSVVTRTQPQTLGYETADWAWHYRDAKPWTDDTVRN